ncbi:hypothetical protein M9H77_29440 [Catharanthus roseus]|uniref:Uncharacterized protein n=1 Tax=Catharanthus roseus TaxID=4058 RepID=A0ACB9ZYN7_CATRO|nr:hypothetical protein M9H77_29440 [Catharanthus roseus]
MAETGTICCLVRKDTEPPAGNPLSPPLTFVADKDFSKTQQLAELRSALQLPSLHSPPLLLVLPYLPHTPLSDSKPLPPDATVFTPPLELQRFPLPLLIGQFSPSLSFDHSCLFGPLPLISPDTDHPQPSSDYQLPSSFNFNSHIALSPRDK